MPLPEGWTIADVAALNAEPSLSAVEIRRIVEGGIPAREAVAASGESLGERAGLDPEAAQAAREALADGAGSRETAAAAAARVALVSLWDKCYPASLKEIPDPPPLLYVRGRLPESPSIGIVGTRSPTPYGAEQAGRFARDLARVGLCIASGLARGVDACAHKGALAASGGTVAFLGSGLCDLYPPEHAPLADEIVASGGAVASEFPMRAAPLAKHFPRRNRLISGVSAGILVIEAALKSGSLITAGFALEQNREVFAVPGRLDHPNSRGGHALIQGGAKLVTGAEDVLDEMEPGLIARLRKRAASSGGEGAAGKATGRRNPDETKVLAALQGEDLAADEIIGRTRIPAGRVLSLLLLLELKREIVRVAGGRFARAARGG